MTDEEPDFEAMSLFELLKYDHDLKKNNLIYGTVERFDKWLDAIQNTVPFAGIIESIDSLEADIESLFELKHNFEKLLNFLSKKLGPVEIDLKEWINK